MNSKASHGRSSSHGRKTLPPHARPTKPPALTRRGTSFSHSHSHHSIASCKAGSGWTKKVGGGSKLDEDDDMASFLQFCATCEKQIVTPSSSILYCSEACRRRDSESRNPSIPHSPLMTPHSTLDMPPNNIIPQLSPTVLRPASLTLSDLTISDSGSPTDDFHPFYLRQHDTDVTSYLEQFDSFNWTSTGTHSSQRTLPKRSNTLNENTTIPSLTHTPSSSVGTVSSIPPIRPLPSRHHPSYTSFASKPIDLEQPDEPPTSPTQSFKTASLKSYTSTTTAFRLADPNDLTYHSGREYKRTTNGRHDSNAQNTLRQLYSHDAILKAPRV
ncbi:Hypothetical protein R9X50_00600900 [Acrodontium crateriforme]|uniref:Life-span regulatory factor-domain-containing protein n=1 Tax=Acrodontium crateriforme TaxID=150365 RepID=A0AAQ3R9K4_9PEZI|nr:Hypothetical protein R9X50_00600900 [Acrodontium crateriforme]